MYIAALIEEKCGRTDAADRFFERALHQVHQTTQKESIRSITISYASALRARGEYERSARLYSAIAEHKPGDPASAAE